MVGMTKMLTLNDSTPMPQLGFGVWELTGDVAYNSVRRAIEVGYRHIDTASLYKNETEVGRAINDAVAAGDVTRDELFVTTKLWNDQHHEPEVGYQQSLERLGLDYVDLYLLHWPCPAQRSMVKAFDGMAKMQGYGTVQSIGVANFYPEALDELITRCGIVPVVNQVELHPGFSQSDIRAADAERDIVTQAWSPLGRGSILDNPVLVDIARELDATPAQVCIAFVLGLGLCALPRSSNPERIEENFRAQSLVLSEEQMSRILALDSDENRIGPDPRVWPES
ncbi:aldo/keto reductase [Corynebacterium aquilae]|uniref:Aldo/keto reductase n=1 Tax=Corynebacterium aquilae DSM 44791 TaxID=1431546 RepID=A0A1L7CEP3_9CORY|nr:aldo/keto reductase [Corynebacterium aquilae]APT84305.1 aldo/keto reductase [Corynebacterium aquilae DSM 44791]